MILSSLHIAGFGRLVDQTFSFRPGLNIIYGLNETGKSTLTNALIATLYGVERKKELWRPWDGSAYQTTLRYTLGSGESIEIQRNFDLDGKGIRVYGRGGSEISGQFGSRKITPGDAHLRIPLDVFLNAACIKQQAIAIDSGREAESTITHLARALDGGPRDDAALGAISRLDAALRLHVGTERASKHTPLRKLRERADEEQALLDRARARVAADHALRDRIVEAHREVERLTWASAEIERRSRSLNAGSIATRLANLLNVRHELRELDAAHAAFDDVSTFPLERELALENAFTEWIRADRFAVQAEGDAQREQLLQTRAAAESVSHPNTAARRPSPVRVAVIVAVCAVIGCAIGHLWTWAELAGLAALLGGARLIWRSVAQASRQPAARSADSVHLEARATIPTPCAERARTQRMAASDAGARFDSLAAEILGPASSGDRSAQRALCAARAARRRERDGIQAHLHALQLRCSTLLGDDAESALEAELADLVAHGVNPADHDPAAVRALEVDRTRIADALEAARHASARLDGELTAGQAHTIDLAQLDERLATTRLKIATLEAFEAAVTLARSTIEHRMLEAHAAFAERLQSYAGAAFGKITGGRYGEIYVDPATLAIRVRIPETSAIVRLDSLSAGTRDQAYLVVRLAMVRVFCEGLEQPPLLLDDPFAFWDIDRVGRCLPILEAAQNGQALLFTSDAELASLAARRGAHRIDLCERTQATPSLEVAVSSTAMSI